jgi:uncharacterized protein
VLWRRLDPPGHDAAALRGVDDGWELVGVALFVDQRGPCRLEYRVRCDSKWRTRSCTVTGWAGREPVHLEIHLERGRWTLGGRHYPEVDGCVDVDLSFSPATNLLPLRRLNLAEGASAEARAAWVAWPLSGLEPLDQRYERTGPTTYHYQSDQGRFTTDLTVHPSGFITRYPELWEAEAVS